MNPEEQKNLTKEICARIANDICAKIDSGKIPEEWDGIELRQYIADQAAWSHMEKGRRRAYNNTVLVNNL